MSVEAVVVLLSVGFLAFLLVLGLLAQWAESPYSSCPTWVRQLVRWFES
ncbi:hypothetical protein SEA_GHOBES_43 [Gordonia phage Ghobes]|uniref:Uncharacterized protein n=1 Tax=Gordonia phage Ghobes TaxID=1887647 RepID=A0A1B3B067_9CAUD|nr:hypothetical protein KCH37_gp43 [Gordonia phage Ghobes]AOE44394.1 hypothetical protein SEA_GHOBES_43 [Gordonia phage Ghobes]